MSQGVNDERLCAVRTLESLPVAGDFQNSGHMKMVPKLYGELGRKTTSEVITTHFSSSTYANMPGSVHLHANQGGEKTGFFW